LKSNEPFMLSTTLLSKNQMLLMYP